MRFTCLPPIDVRYKKLSRASGAGFTLIEMLVVLFIIGLVTGMAVLSLGVLGTDQGLNNELTLWTNQIKLVSERAGLEGQDYGIYVDPHGFEIERLNVQSGLWERLTPDMTLAPHLTPKDIQLHLMIDGTVVSLTTLSPADLKKVPFINDSTRPPKRETETHTGVLDDSEGREDRFNKAFDSPQTSGFINRVPQIWITAGGELTPFELTVSRASSPVQLTLKANADLSLHIESNKDHAP